MTFIATASPKRFATAALKLLRESPEKTQVYRVDGDRDVPVDVDTILRRPGNYVLRVLQEFDDDDDRWVDVTTTSTTTDDEEETHGNPRSAAARGDRLLSENWTLLVQSQQKTIDRQALRIAELEGKIEKGAKREDTLKEDLAEVAAEAENGAGKWADVVMQLAPQVLDALRGAQFRQELAARLQGAQVTPERRDELLELLNSDALRGPKLGTGGSGGGG